MKKDTVMRKAGFSMIEVSVAMAIAATTCVGLYSMGTTVRRSGEHLRISTEAQAFGKEALEEIIAAGAENLAMPGCKVGMAATTKGTSGAEIRRGIEVIWHDPSGAQVTNRVENGYAEVHVNVTYPAPRSDQFMVTTYSTIL